MQDNKVFVYRISFGKSGVFGVMLDWLKIPFAVTLENEETLIPAGIYECDRTLYHKRGYATFEIKVQGHSRVLFHKLNLDTQSMACIGIAEKFFTLNNIPAIGESAEGFGEFAAKYIKHDKIILEIKNLYEPN